MKRTEFLETVEHLDDFGKNAQAALKEFQVAHAQERDRYPDQEVERWIANKKRTGERFTKSEIAEIRAQAAADVAEARDHADRVLEGALTLAEEKATAAEEYSKVLRPEWTEVATGDYSRNMIRMADDVAATTIRERLTGASVRAVAQAYHAAVEQDDRIAQRIIEAGMLRDGGGPPLDTTRPDLEDIMALWTLVKTMHRQRRTRHPAAAVALRATVAAVRTDPAVTVRRQIRLVESVRSRMIA